MVDAAVVVDEDGAGEGWVIAVAEDGGVVHEAEVAEGDSGEVVGGEAGVGDERVGRPVEVDAA